MRLTLDYLKDQVADTAYAYDGTFTTCTITTKAGTKLVGTSGCLDPKNYVQEKGEEVAYNNALSQLWALEGYFFAKLGANTLPGQAIAVLSSEDVGLHSGDEIHTVYSVQVTTTRGAQ